MNVTLPASRLRGPGACEAACISSHLHASDSRALHSLLPDCVAGAQAESPVAGHHDLDITEHEPAPAEFSDDDDEEDID